MAGFGGAVKLTGESEYRRALQAITQSLREVDSELKVVTSQFGKTDDSEEALTAQTEILSKKLDVQKQKVGALADKLKDLEQKAQSNKEKHQALQEALDKETAELKKIGDECGKTSDEYKDQAKKVSELADEYKKSIKNIDDQENALSKARTELNNATADMNKTEKELESLGSEFENAACDADKLGKGARDAGDAAQESSKGWTVLKGVIADLASTAIQSAINGLRSLAQEALDASDSLDKFATTMSFAGYDSATISKAQADVKEYADVTVYELNTIANTSAQLAANGIDDFQGLTEAAGNLNAVAGGNADTFRSVAMVLTQTAGAGKLTTENWNQLANAIPGASGVLMDALRDAGAYTGDFREAMAKGEITAEEFNDAIMKLGSDPVAVEAAKSVTTFEGAVGNLKANVVNAFMEIYETIGKENITKVINKVSKTINKIIPPIKNAIKWLIDHLPEIAPILGGIAGALTALMVAEKIQAVVTAFQAWKAATEGVTIAQKLLNLVMAANPVMLLVTVLGTLIGAIVALMATNEEFRENLIAGWNAIKDGFKAVWDGIVTFFTETLPDILVTAAETISTWVTDVIDFVAELPVKLWGFFTDIIKSVGTWAADMAVKAKNAATKFFDNIVDKIVQLPSKLWEFLSDIVSKVANWAKDIGTKAKDAASNFFSNIIDKIKQLPSNIWDWFTKTLAKVGDFGKDMISKAKDAAKNTFDAIKDKLSKLPEKIKKIGGDLVKGLWNGINDKVQWVIDKVKTFGSKVMKGLKEFFGIASPSKVMRDQVGKYLAEGIGVGFSEEMKNVEAEMQDALPTSFDVGTTLNAKGSDVSGLGFNYTVLVNAFRDALEDVNVELDDVRVGKFVRKTVTDAIYT